MTPQLTEPQGHVLRVSFVREILRVVACAYSDMDASEVRVPGLQSICPITSSR